MKWSTEELIEKNGPSSKILLQNGDLAACEVAKEDYFFCTMPDRLQKPLVPMPGGPQGGDSEGPKSPAIPRPDTRELLKRMKKVDPEQSKRYRQRTGQ